MSNIKDLDTLCYIAEQTSFPEDFDGKEFGYEITPSHQPGKFYVTFDTVLHSFRVMNRNGREYDKDNIWQCIQTDPEIQHNLKTNQWYGTIDHPAPMHQGEELTMQYIANPDPKLSSHFIHKPRMNGNFLEATIQTDTGTEAGMNMALKIVDGKITPCFSARSFGTLKNEGRPVVYVKKLITYDWVRFPSHIEALAKVNQPTFESVQNDFEKYAGVTIIFFPQLAQMAAASSKETEWLCESFGLTMDDIIGVTSSGNSVVVQEGANTYVQPITDQQVRRKTQSILRDVFN